MKNFFKRTALYSIAGLITAANVALANNKVIENLNKEDLFVYHGNLRLTNSKLNNAEIMGSNHLYNNDFGGPVMINGNSDIKENNFKCELSIQGNIKSESNNFSEKVRINGNIKDIESIFNNETTVIGKAQFDQSHIKSLRVDSNDLKLTDVISGEINFYNEEDPRSINVYLKNNSKVEGNIVFSNNKGKVYADDTAKVIGEIIGGELIVK